MMRRFLGLLLALAACTLAQGPDSFPWWDSPLARDLNLTEDQRQQIRATISEYRDRLIEQRANVEKAEGRLQDLMNEDPVDEARASQAIDRVVTARAELMRSFSQMSLKLRTVLTAQQWQELQKRRMQRRRPPEGPGPRPGPRRRTGPPARDGAAQPEDAPRPE